MSRLFILPAFIIAGLLFSPDNVRAEDADNTEVTISLPEEVHGSGVFIAVKAVTNGKEVKWVNFDGGLDIFPADLLKDSKTIVVGARKDGVYRLGAYTALGDKPSDMAFTKVIVGDGKPEPDPNPNPPQDSLKEKVEGWFDTVPTPSKVEIGNIAEAIRGVGDNPQKFKTLDEIKSGLGAVLGQTIKDVNGWRKFGSSMMEYTNSLEKSGEIKTPEDFAEVLVKIASTMSIIKFEGEL